MSEVLEPRPLGPVPGRRYTIRNRHDPKLSFETDNTSTVLMHMTMGNAVYDRDVPMEVSPEHIATYRALLFRDVIK